MFVINPPAGSNAESPQIFYVNLSTGDDENLGTSPYQAWKTIAHLNTIHFQPGDTILLNRNDSWDEDLTVNSSGTVSQPILFGSYGDGPRPSLRRLTIYGDYTIFQNILIDHQRIESDAVRVQAKHVTLRSLEIRNGGRDGVDASDADGLQIENCLIHHFLAGSFTNQVDAHGIVATDIQGLTIQETEIHHVSGDSFQADPSRSVNVPMDILIINSHFWTGPLDEDFNDWQAGETPGENAIDTKVAVDGWDQVERATITIQNMLAHGWIQDGYISNRAVFNMKEKIEAVFDGVTVYNAEIAFRIRGTRGNANTTLKNIVVYGVDKAIRAEDDLRNLNIYHSTFGGAIDTLLQIAGGGGGVGSWDWRNNTFLDQPPPPYASDPTNRTATSQDFLHSFGHNYHLASSSSLIDIGDPSVAVEIDRDGRTRPFGSGFDVGAYEFIPTDIHLYLPIGTHQVVRRP